jgi:hypothetical protein
MAKLLNISTTSTTALVPPSGTQAQRTPDTIVSFTSTGTTSWTVPSGITSVEVLIVAGGGAGGTSNAAGGGAGGLIYRPNYSVTPGQTYTVTVGAGNTNPQRIPENTAAFKGGNSVFDALTALGGGNGAGDDYSGIPGGSGGGSADNPDRYGGLALQANSPSGGFGNKGGDTLSWNNDGGTGGGGAGGAGRNHGEATSYDGGPGLLFDITDTPTFYAGGGGGFRRDVTGYGPPQGSGSVSPAGTGRSGAGGRGGGGSGHNGQPGVTNTGGGGGGSPTTGGNGGPGIVVLRYNPEIGGSSVGSMRYNNSMSRFEVRQNGNWIPTYRQVSTFTSSGNFSVPTGIQKVEVLVVAGGGGGGQDVGGGGGGGGVVEAFDYPVAPGTSIPITIGSGGRGANRGGHPSANGETGGNSTFGSLTAFGGGGGGVWANNNAQGGGSGGGAGATPGAWNSFGGNGNQPDQSNLGATNYGNPGGASSAGNAPLYGRGAGGGGAGTPGEPSGPGHTGGGKGGDGIASSISGDLQWYGGGGAGTNDQGTHAAYPGKGGGGQGKRSTGGAESYMDGTSGTGGGGAGGTNEGGNGGPGIVIVRF